MKSLARAAACWVIFAGSSFAGPIQIEKNTTWSGERTLDGRVTVAKGVLTIEPGAKIAFKPGGEIQVGRGAALIAQGTQAKPIDLIGGDKAGIILGNDCEILLQGCHLSQMAGSWSGRPTFLCVTPGQRGVALRNCTMTDCGGTWITVAGPFEMTGCDIRRRAGLYAGDGGQMWIGGDGSQITITGNTVTRVIICRFGGNAPALLAGNVLVDTRLGDWESETTIVEGNYVHNPLLDGSFGLLRIRGTIRSNVVRGGTWTTCAIGGTITGNVFETLSREEVKKSCEAGFKDNCTHENLSTLLNKSVVARNILINASYGAVMGAGDGLCSDCVVRNNTFDLRSGTAPVWLNHLNKSKPKNLVIRNNLFLRTGRIFDEVGIPDTISCVDYNLWAGTKVDAPSTRWPSERFVRITISGKKEGDDGFGAHDVLVRPGKDKPLDPRSIVADPDFVLPFSDEEMLARKHTVKECLELYRKAYSLQAGSPAIDAGSPEDGKDPEVKDGKCDIGAIEYAGRTP
jgi:hypothetical protein